MTNRDKLRDNYEDALFALLMDSWAQQEGERLIRENAALKDDPAAAVPEETERRCLQTIRRELSRCKRRISFKGVGRVLGRVAIAAALTLALITTAFAVSPELRVKTLNLLLSFTEEAAIWRAGRALDWSETDTGGLDVTVSIRQLPEGYQLSNADTDSKHYMTTTYINPDGEEIELHYSKTNGAYSASLDIEDPDYYEETTIHGYTAIIVDKHGLLSIAWAEEDQGLMIFLYATDLSVEELKAIANDLIFE